MYIKNNLKYANLGITSRFMKTRLLSNVLQHGGEFKCRKKSESNAPAVFKQQIFSLFIVFQL